jgi:hypothetical protein
MLGKNDGKPEQWIWDTHVKFCGAELFIFYFSNVFKSRLVCKLSRELVSFFPPPNLPHQEVYCPYKTLDFLVLVDWLKDRSY